MGCLHIQYSGCMSTGPVIYLHAKLFCMTGGSWPSWGAYLCKNLLVWFVLVVYTCTDVQAGQIWVQVLVVEAWSLTGFHVTSVWKCPLASVALWGSQVCFEVHWDAETFSVLCLLQPLIKQRDCLVVVERCIPKLRRALLFPRSSRASAIYSITNLSS